MAGGASYDDELDVVKAWEKHGTPAFPQQVGSVSASGITERRYIAMHLMQGVLASGDVPSDPAMVCRSVLALADALIAADKAS